VGYKGSSQLLTDLIGGFIDVAWVPLNVTKQMIDSGKLKLLAINSRRNANEFANVPKMNKRYPGLENTDGFCVVLPKGASAESVAFWSKIIREYMNDEQAIKEAAANFNEISEFGPGPLKTSVESLAKAFK
jgi:tripartite-type tricarboxylate transporter receptor subunit TctC